MGCGLKSAKEAEAELVGLSRREMAEEGAGNRWAEKDKSSTCRRDRRKTDRWVRRARSAGRKQSGL